MTKIDIKVSLNGLRRNATHSYNQIVKYLNESSLQEWEKADLEEHFQDLHFALAVLNACSVEEVANFDDVSEKLKFEEFNPQKDG